MVIPIHIHTVHTVPHPMGLIHHPREGIQVEVILVILINRDITRMVSQVNTLLHRLKGILRKVDKPTSMDLLPLEEVIRHIIQGIRLAANMANTDPQPTEHKWDPLPPALQELLRPDILGMINLGGCTLGIKVRLPLKDLLLLRKIR